MLSWLASISVCLLLSGATQAQQVANPNQAVTEIIRLQYRSPDHVRAAIAAYLDSRGSISQFDNSLIISTSRANLGQLQQLIDEMDIPLRRVRINVDFAYDETSVSADGVPADEMPEAEQDAQNSSHQSIVINEDEAVWFHDSASTPTLLPAFAAYTPESALADDSMDSSANSSFNFGASVEFQDNRLILRTLIPQSVVIGAAAADADSELQNRLLSNVIELQPGQWFVLNAPAEEGGNAEQALVAVQVELL